MSHLAIPVRHTVDLLFVGANSAAIAAAAEAARAGARVLVLAERPYLAEDLTGALRLVSVPGDRPRSALARTLFGDDGRNRPTPMEAKAACDAHLLAAGVQFCYGCFPYAVLRDAAGATAGAVMASRGGLFAVRAAVTVDATWRANVARLAGLAFDPYPAGEQIFTRVVVGGALRRGAGISGMTDAEPVSLPGKDGVQTYFIHRYALRIAMTDNTPASFAAAEARAGAMTFDPQQAKVGDLLWQVPPDALCGNKRVVTQVDTLGAETFATVDAGLWVLGPCAAIPRPLAEELTRPATFLAVGERLGAALAHAAKRQVAAGPVSVQQSGAEKLTQGRLRTEQDLLRQKGTETVAVPSDRLPRLSTADVVVMGGGTAGAAAGIAAARQGARTVVCEYQSALGGVGTVGMITQYYFGNRVGFTVEIDAGTRAMGPAVQAPKNAGWWKIEWKQRWYQFASDQAGAQVWHGSIGCGAVVDGDIVRGVVVATPWGVGLVACSAVVDASGNADIAAHAGAPTETIGGDHMAMQGTGLGPRQPGQEYRNTDWTFIDDTDVVDTTQAMVVARNKFKGEFDLSTLIDSRERRRIIGDLSMSPLDFLAQRTFPDTITTAHSNFDTHGFTIHPLFLVEPPDKSPLNAHVPFRCLLPKTLANVAVTGLGKCAHRDALPVIRMQPDVQNEGYAMGVAAAWAARDSAGRLRSIDVAALQAHLVEIGTLAAEVPAHVDSFPLSEERIAAALADPFGFINLAVIFAHGEELRPRLGSAHAAAEGAARLRYALILGLLGDPAGANDLAAAIAAEGWDAGWNYRGMGQFGRSASALDALIIALGRCGSAAHSGTIIAKITTLTGEDAMSHSRAVAEACESLHLTSAAPALAAVLALPGVSGHHQHDVVLARDTVDPDRCDNNTRNRSLRELHLARALYRVGDHGGLGARILNAYATDLRGIFARHAQAILAVQSDVRVQRATAG